MGKQWLIWFTIYFPRRASSHGQVLLLSSQEPRRHIPTDIRAIQIRGELQCQDLFPTACSPADCMPGHWNRGMPSIALSKKQGVQMFDSVTMILPLGPHWGGLKKTNHMSLEECRCSRKQRLWVLRLLSWNSASWMVLHSPDSIKY